tara:strand:+ start:1000 stop:1296 length:297 start_codon:yes stop_codon:yes gene_type:complete
LVCRPARRSSDPAGPAVEWSQTSCILLDAYTPAKIAEQVKKAGAAKAIFPLVRLFAPAVRADVLIVCSATFYFVVGSKFGLGPGAARLFGGVSRSRLA